MSLLTDTDLLKLADTDLLKLVEYEPNWTDKNRLYISPSHPDCLTPVGYDVRVGRQYASAIDGELHEELKDSDDVIIKPGDVVLITTLEYVGMPQNRSISALITSRVSIVSKGLSHISTNIDPDWKGKLLIALHNPSRNTVTLKCGERLCTLNFFKNETEATKDCEKEPGRTDVLLNQFVSSVKLAKAKKSKRETRRYWLRFGLKAIIILLCCALGWVIFKNSIGFVAMTSLGVGIASNISWPKK